MRYNFKGGKKLRAAEDYRVCAQCGVTFARPLTYGKVYWSTRAFCGLPCGNKYRAAHRADQFWAKAIPEPNTGCWLWTGIADKNGYGSETFFAEGWRAHRLAYTLAKGTIPAGLFVMHSCDTPACINPEHLSLGTVRDNAADMVARGRQVKRRGELNTMAVLTPAEVIDIRADARPAREVARDYEISEATIYDIRTRRSWAHL